MGGFLSWLSDEGNDIYDSYIKPSFTTAYDAVDDYLPALMRENYYKPNENDLQPISRGELPRPDASPAQNSIPNIDDPNTGFLGDFWEGLKKGASSELENNPLSPTNIGKAIAVPKQGLDYLAALDPLGLSPGGNQVKLDENYKPVSPTLGQTVGPMLLPHKVGESPDDANPFLRRASETVTDFMADPSLAAMKLPGIAKLLLPGIVESTASEAGNLWSQLGDQGKSITDIDVQEGLGSFIPSLVMAAQAAHGTMAEVPHLAKSIPEIQLGGGYSSRSPIDLNTQGSALGIQIPNFASAMADGRTPSFLSDLVQPTETLHRPRPLYRTIAEHGTPNIDNWVDQGRTPKPSEDGTLGAGLYLSQLSDSAPSYSGRATGDPRVLKGDVSAEKPLFLDAPAPRDLRMQAFLELNKAKRAGTVDPAEYETIKTNILDPNTTAGYLAIDASELVKKNIPATERGSYTGDPYSEFLRSRGYDLWQTDKPGVAANELVVTDPRRQFKVGESYNPKEKAYEKVLGDEDVSGMYPETELSKLATDESSLEAVKKLTRDESLANPTTRIKESTTPETTDIAEWIDETPTPKPIKIGEWVDKAARTLGYQDLPGASRIQGESLDPASKFMVSQRKKYGKDWEQKQTPEEATFLKKLLENPDSASYEKVEEPKLSEPSEDPDIRAIQEGLLAKPVQGEEPVGLSPSAEAKLAEIQKGRKAPVKKDIAGESLEKQDFQVTLSNGKSYKVRAGDEVEAQEKVQDLIDKHGSDFQITGVKRKYSTLESDIITKASPRETQLTDKLAGEQAKEEIAEKKAETKARTKEEALKEKAQLQELRDQLKVEQQKAKAGDKEAKLREKAIEREIKDKLKVEESFRKAEAKRKQKEYQDKLAQESNWRNSPPVKLLNSAKSIAYGGDIGHLLRQGKQMNIDLLFSKHAKKVVQQFPTIFKAAKSEKWFEDYHKKLAADPTIKLLTEKFGLDMPGVGKGLKEEVFHGEGYAEKIPGLGRFYAKPSERAYTAGMNFLRAAEATKLVEGLKKQGKTPENSPEAYKGVARAINIISQRGEFSANFAKNLADASFLFGAPRAKAARIQSLVELARGGESGAIVRKTAAKMIAFNLGMMALLQATRKDGEFVTDPSRTDFGKFRDGNTTIDPWVGLGTTVRTIVQTGRSLSNEKAKSPHSGREYVMSPADPAIKEVSNMTAPGLRAAFILAFGVDLGSKLTGKPAGGYLVDRAEAISQILPMSPKQVKEILDEPGGYEKIIYSAMQVGGEGIDTFNYEKAQAEQRRLKKERGIKTRPPSGKKRKFSF